MKCPRCDTSLKPVTYEGVRVGLCPTCKGVLVTEKGLEAIETTHGVEVGRDAHLAVSGGLEVGRTCPRCGAGMKKASYSKIASITVDRCEPCACVWLDRGELEAIQSLYENYDPRAAGLREQKAAAAVPPMTCPKCGHVQPRGDECARCGVVVAKVLARQAGEGAVTAKGAGEASPLDRMLERSSGFSVDQKSHAIETWFEWEVCNQYGLSVRGTPYQWRAAERSRGSSGWWMRNSVLAQFMPFTVRVLDHRTERVVDVKRPAGLFMQEVHVTDGRGVRVGSVHRRMLSIRNDYRVCTTTGMELFAVTARRVLPRTFRVTRAGREIGQVRKRWGGVGRELLTDADHFTLTFPPDLDTRAKLLLLGTVFFIDYVHFERRGRKSGGDGE